MGTPIFGGILNAGLRSGDFDTAIPSVFLAAVPIAVLALVAGVRLPGRTLRDHVELPEPVPGGARTGSRPD